MRKVATFAAAVMLGSGMAVLGGGSAAQAAQVSVIPARTKCYTTMPVTPRRPGQHRPVQPTCPGWGPAYTTWLHIGHR